MRCRQRTDSAAIGEPMVHGSCIVLHAVLACEVTTPVSALEGGQ